MSDRIVYRNVPLQQRICSYHLCHKPIIRNIARTKEGRLWHWGCLQSARDKQYKCLDCYGTFDATQAILEEKQKLCGDDIKELFGLICPICSSRNIKPCQKYDLSYYCPGWKHRIGKGAEKRTPNGRPLCPEHDTYLRVKPHNYMKHRKEDLRVRIE